MLSCRLTLCLRGEAGEALSRGGGYLMAFDKSPVATVGIDMVDTEWWTGSQTLVEAAGRSRRVTPGWAVGVAAGWLLVPGRA